MSRSTRNQRRGNSQSANIVEQKRTCFFRITVLSNVQDKQLRLPIDFVRKHSSHLSDIVVLKIPDGNAWDIKLRRADGKIWFQSGWEAFAQHYSIDVGHFLVFTYDGNATFHVLICDMSCAEIDYPTKTGGRSLVFENKESKMNTLEDLGRNSPASNIRESVPPLGNHQQVYPTSGVGEPFVKRRGRPCSGYGRNTNGVIQAAQKFQSENPWFMIVMQPSYVLGTFCLNVPAGQFMKTYLRESQEVSLCVNNDKRTWKVRCSVYARNQAKIHSGWKAFANDNGVEGKDVCVFELIRIKNPEFKVSIYRAVDYVVPEIVSDQKIIFKKPPQ